MQPTYLTAILKDGTRYEMELGEQIHRGGAAGSIYINKSEKNSVAKIFHDAELSEYYREKLDAMLENIPDFPPAITDGEEYVQIAWPDAILEDSMGRTVGYLMPLIKMEQALSLDYMMQKAVRRKVGLSEKYSHRLFAAYNLASMVAALHQCGHYMIDLKPANISVYKKNMLVAIVDCDGFSIGGKNGERFPAEYVSEEYICPENSKLSSDDMGEEQDRFALATIIFRLLNNGIHPFSGVPNIPLSEEQNPIQNRIDNFWYAYSTKKECPQQKPHPYSMHEYFDAETLEMFERAFTDAANRPSAAEWKNHIWHILKRLKQCPANEEHYYFGDSCGLCAQEKKLKKNIEDIKKEQTEAATPKTLGFIPSITASDAPMRRRNQAAIKVIYGLKSLFVLIYGLFFLNLDSIIMPYAETIKKFGFGLELGISFAVISIMKIILKQICKQSSRSEIVTNVMVCYAVFFIILNILKLHGVEMLSLN